MRVLFAASEIYPLAKTGGLADVGAALPVALAERGVDVRLILPAYPEALEAAANKSVHVKFEDAVAGTTRLITARMPDSGLPVWLVDTPLLFNRRGLYQDQNGIDWADNAERFAHLSRIATGIGLGRLALEWRPDVVHANDWHLGLLPAFLHTAQAPRPATLFTIHNLAYQGLFPTSVFPKLGLPSNFLSVDGLEFYGKVSFLKAGICFSDHMTTVSRTYAHEVTTQEFGCGLEGLLRRRKRALSGILNGIDDRIWDPSGDPHLTAPFGRQHLAGKSVCKAALQRELGLAPASDLPLVVYVSRLTEQKMADLVLKSVPDIMRRQVQMAVLGEGDAGLERQFIDLAQLYPGQFAAYIGYEEPLAHRFHAGADILLHPSRFEPCGLTPLYALRYGAVPVVRGVGGLVDTIIDATDEKLRRGTANGVVFEEVSPVAMLAALDRALALYAQPILWRRLQSFGMSQDFGWNASARHYSNLYRKLVPDAEPTPATLGRRGSWHRCAEA
jgi:starch synthase